MRVLKQWPVLMVAAVCALLAVPGPTMAQGGSGSIAGYVKDPTGAAVPGVTVEVASPALIERVRTGVSDGQGNYKITELRPGVYSVTFTLAGFSTVKREGIELSAGFTAPVNAELKVGSVSETITVTGASPIVDVQSVRTQSVLKNEVLDALPSGQRDIAQLASLTLGAMPSSAGRNDVGGDRGERSTGISLHGSRGDDSRLNYDGMNTNVFYGGAGGQQRTYKFNTVMVAEQVVDTAGSTSDTETGGANVNMVPKDGGNKFSLFGAANYTGNQLASGKVPDSLIARGSAPDQNSMRKVWDYGIGIGGPIRQDKLWFYSGDRWWGSQSYVANNYFNKSNLFYTYVPDLSRPAYSDIYNSDFGGRLTWQATSKQKVSFEQHYQNACACWESLTATTAPEGTNSYLYKPHYLSQGSWSYPATNRLLLQAGGSLLRAQVQFLSRGAFDAPGRIRVSDTNYPGIGAYAWGGIGASVQTDNGDAQRQDNFNYRAAASYITGTHAVRIGFQGLRGTFDTRGHAPAPGYVLGFTAGVPTSLTQYADPFKMDGRVKSAALYASDQWTISRLTVTMGVRYDHFNVGTLPVDIPAGRFIGSRHYDARQDIPNYNDITPRVGAAYDLFGNGKTAIRGSWGRYLVGLGGGALTNLAPSNAIVASTARPWNDSLGVATPITGVIGNGNFVPDCDLTNFGANGECGPIVTAGFGQPTTTLAWDDKARQGWGVREFDYQWNVAVQQELRPSFGVQAGFYHTDFHNSQVAVNTALSASSFDYFCVPAPSDERLGSISGQQVCGNTNVNFASKAVVANTVWFRPEDVPISGFSGERKETYNGGDVSLNWRFKGAGLLSGGLSLGKQIVDTCFAKNYPQITGTIAAGGSTAIPLRDDKFCTNKAQSLWNGAGSQVKIQAVYPLPYDFMLAATYKHLPGAALTGTVTYANAAVSSILGRNLSACAAPTGACTQTASIGVIPPGTLFDDRLNQVDLRGTRRIKIGRSRIQGIFELYNVLNARPAQSATATWGQVTAPGVATPGTTFLRPSLLLGGRLLKVGAQIDF
jgi:carboxypeptidase family protein